MKNNFIIVLSVFAIFSCTKVDLNVKNIPATLSAVFEQETKTSLNNDSNHTMLWSGSEKITLIDVSASPHISTTFSNTSGSGTKASFVADDPSFDFTVGHDYIACLYCSYSENVGRIRLTYTNYSSGSYNYNSSGTYGLPDNSLPMMCCFTYENSSSVQGLRFKNISTLLVLEVTNASTNASAKMIGSVILSQASSYGSAWGYSIFDQIEGTYSQFASYDYTSMMGLSSSTSFTVNCPIAVCIPIGESVKIGIPVSMPHGVAAYDLTVSIKDGEGNNVCPDFTKTGLTKSSYGLGEIRKWTLNIVE